MHLPHHQEMLRNAANHGGIDAVMATIAKENPRALHVESDARETLSSRNFQHQPNTMVPHQSYVSNRSVAPLYARDEHVKRLGKLPDIGAAIEATDETAALA